MTSNYWSSPWSLIFFSASLRQFGVTFTIVDSYHYGNSALLRQFRLTFSNMGQGDHCSVHLNTDYE